MKLKDPEVIRPMLPPGHIETVWKHLSNHAHELKQSLTEDQELIATAYLFGGDQIKVETFSYAGPNLLIVTGSSNGRKVDAYIHQAALQIVFSVVPRDPMKGRQPLGFLQPE